MASLGRLNIDITANLENALRGFNRLDRRLGSLERNIIRTQRNTSVSTIAMGNAWVKFAEISINAMSKITQKTLELVTSSSKLALQYESSMIILQNVFGNASNVIVDFSRTQARALNLSKASVIEYGNTFGTLLLNIGLAKEATAGYSIELLKAAAVIQSNKPQFTMETVLSKMRSGILGNTQSIDDLGIEAKVGMLRATNAFKKFAQGRAWQDIPFQTQQIIRLLGILEQKTNIYGNTLARTTNTNLSQFKTILNDASLALGQAFLPVIQRVIPVLIDFAKILEDVSIAMKTFSETIFDVKQEENKLSSSGDKATNSIDSVTNSIDKATKSARKSLAPFDKLNNLQEQMAKTTTTEVPATQKGGIGDGGDGKIFGPPSTSAQIRTSAIKQFAKETALGVKGLTNAIKNAGKAWDAFNKPIKVGEGFFDSLKENATEAKNILLGLRTGLGVIEPDFQNYNKMLENSKINTTESLTNMNMDFNNFFKERLKSSWHEPELKWYKGFGNIVKNTKTQLGEMESDVDTTMENMKNKDWTGVKTSWDNSWKDIRTGIGEQLSNIETDVENTTINIQKEVEKMRLALASVTGTPAILSQTQIRGETIPSYKLIDDNLNTDFLQQQDSGLGDFSNTIGTNIGNNSTQKVEVQVNLDSREIARGVYDPLNQESQRRGAGLLGLPNPSSPFFK